MASCHHQPFTEKDKNEGPCQGICISLMKMCPVLENICVILRHILSKCQQLDQSPTLASVVFHCPESSKAFKDCGLYPIMLCNAVQESIDPVEYDVI